MKKSARLIRKINRLRVFSPYSGEIRRRILEAREKLARILCDIRIAEPRS